MEDNRRRSVLLDVAPGPFPTPRSASAYAGTGEVSISAATKLTLDAPVIEIAAAGQLEVSSGGAMDIASGGPMDVQGSILRLNGGSVPAARVGDTVVVSTPMGAGQGTIATGSSTVFTD